MLDLVYSQISAGCELFFVGSSDSVSELRLQS